MSKFVEYLDGRWYPGVEGNWDDTQFRVKIQKRLSGDSEILDVGAGAGIVTQMNFIDVAARVSGIDPDPRVLENPFLTDGTIGVAEELPYANGSFDIVISDNVLEHLENPEVVFSEIARVLRPGGRFLFKTPNVIHYMPTIARITPYRFHKFVNELRGRKVVDTFPTRYRANSESRLRKLASDAGFRVESIELIESRPEYLRMSVLTYWIGFLYERVVNCSRYFRSMRVVIIGEFIQDR